MKSIPHLDAATIKERTPYPKLIDALDRIFRGGATAPSRHHHTVPQPDTQDATLLLMPAWRSGGALGVKVVNVFPGNSERGLPAVNGIYLIFDGQTGELAATADGSELTARRTAAASALASRYVSTPDASVMLMVGTGRLSRELIPAHCAVRPIQTVLIWGRHFEKAQQVADQCDIGGVELIPTNDLVRATNTADIISAATLSTEPLIHGEHLKPGVHIDLVGAYRCDMRETDDEVMRRANAVYVDTRDGALHEGGDLVIALENGSLANKKIQAQLSELVTGYAVNRSAMDITVFKSVGASIEDLAAAELCLSTGRDTG